MTVIATAGHVDHGKSTFVNFLTKQETDRLPEEKKRGLTINLGYTYFTIEDKTYSIVDVPGHKDFYKNTISGFANVDVILFVIDSIQNWSEQSEQHFQSLISLNKKNFIFVFTKIDLLEGEIKKEFLSEKLKFLKNTLGSHANDVEEDFIKNIIETFDSRMEIVCANMSELARFLKLNSNVKDIYLPTLEGCEEAKLVKGTLERNASALSFRLLGDLERALAFKQKLLSLNNSGEELSPLRKILHPASDLYANVPKEVRNGMGITDDLFQLVVGGGNVKNLIDGLKQEFIEIA